MPNETHAVAAWLSGQHAAMVTLLEKLVNSDSPSRDRAAVDATGEILKAFFAAHGIPTNTIPDATGTYGEAIRASLDVPGSNQRPVMLLGHRDTVFPPGEAGRRPFTIEDGRAYGPGVADMKAGLVMNAFVLAAFKACGGAPAPLMALITSDEEIASPFCRAVIEQQARQARLVLNSEPGRASGNVVSGRKGGAFLRFEVLGKAAHSGANFAEGRSAIGEMAHKIVALHAMTDLDRGITVNVGLVSGGQTVNTTAPRAVGEIDIRSVTAADRQDALDQVAAIMAQSTVPGTTATWEILGEFLPLEGSAKSTQLLELYLGVSAEQGVHIAGEFTGGCADSGYTAAQGIPTLCGLGPVGGKAHTPEEYMEVATMVPRAQAMAMTILRLDSVGL
jgi:glutamate carboxypeptidase